MKIRYCTAALALSLSGAALATPASELQQRLGQVNSFQASFRQTVTSGDGTLIQQGQGKLYVKRPALFNWTITAPDKSELISDGRTLWFYNPMLEQVTATRLEDAAAQTPFILITRNRAADWANYRVEQQGDHFQLTPKSGGSLKAFTIDVTPTGTIRSFSAREQDGQTTRYTLQGQLSGGVSPDKFVFRLPKGVTLDDQRR